MNSARGVGFGVDTFFLSCFDGLARILLVALVMNEDSRSPFVRDPGFAPTLELELTLKDDITLGSSPSLLCTITIGFGLAELCSGADDDDDTFGLGRSSVLVKIDKEDAGAFWKNASPLSGEGDDCLKDFDPLWSFSLASFSSSVSAFNKALRRLSSSLTGAGLTISLLRSSFLAWHVMDRKTTSASLT